MGHISLNYKYVILWIIDMYKKLNCIYVYSDEYEYNEYNDDML